MATQTIDVRVNDKTKNALGNIDRRLQGLEGSLLSVNKVAGLAAAALGAIGGANLVRGVIATTARFQDLRTALSSVAGSAKAGAEAFDFVSQFATKTQFGVDQLAETFIKLKASGIEPTEELLTTFTDTAAVTTDQLGSLTAITDLFARTTSGGLGLEELNRLADRGIPVFRILEERLGLTRLEISEFGKTADGANTIIKALTDGLNESFGGATADRVNNLSTALSNMQIGFQNVQDAVGAGGFGGAMTELVNLLNDALARVVPLAKQIGENLGFAVFQFTKFLKETNFNFALFLEGAQIAIAVLGGAGLVAVLSSVTKGVKALTIALARNPIGLIAVAAASAITYLSMENGLGRTIAQVSAVMNKLGEVFAAVGKFLKDSFHKIISTVTDAFDNFVNGIIDGINAIADFLGMDPIIKATSESMRNAVADVAVEGFNAVTLAVEENVEELTKYISTSDLVQQATEASNSLLADLTKTYQEAGLSYDEAQAAARKEYEATILKNDALEETNVVLPKIIDNTQRATTSIKEQAEVTKRLAKVQEELSKTASSLDPFTFARDLSELENAFNEYQQKILDKTIEGSLERREAELALKDSYFAAELKLYEDFEKRKTEIFLDKVRTRLREEGNLSKTLLTQSESDTLKRIGQTEKLEDRINDRIEFEKKSEFEKYQFGIQQAGKFFDALGTANKKAFEAAKAFNIANAIMNTYAGATKALATYPPPFNFIAAAAVVASGFAQVAAIRSQQYTGRQRGGALAIGEQTVVGEDGPELIVPKQPSTVIPREVAQAIEGMGGGQDSVVVNFNISTVDAEGFDELLISRRGTITGIINNAIQQKGRVGVV